jgi:NAD(P)-dependent dehydrogenase (short-subunit alcohol dehydrogenase family)
VSPTPPGWPGLTDRVALVTGAGRGIGRALALALAAAGARTIAVARTAADLETLVTESGGRIEPWVEDVTQESCYARIEALSTLDVLVNNAGMNRPLPMSDVDPATLDAMIGLNIRALYRISQSASRVMLRAARGGAIVHMSSQMGHVGAPRRTVYCMTKHAVEGLTKAMAVELAPAGIRVNSVAPTFIETDLTRPMFADPVFRRSVEDSIPMGRIGQPADVIGAVLFLASDAASFVTGDSLKVDGGWTAR